MDESCCIHVTLQASCYIEMNEALKGKEILAYAPDPLSGLMLAFDL